MKVRFLCLVRCSENDPFAIDFDTPGGRSGSVTLRVPGGFVKVAICVCEGEISGFGEVF